jgi:hypothetical protein
MYAATKRSTGSRMVNNAADPAMSASRFHAGHGETRVRFDEQQVAAPLCCLATEAISSTQCEMLVSGAKCARRFRFVSTLSNATCDISRFLPTSRNAPAIVALSIRHSRLQLQTIVQPPRHVIAPVCEYYACHANARPLEQCFGPLRRLDARSLCFHN